MRIVALSDTHSYHRKISVPEGDVLVVAGDISWKGELEIISDFASWLKELPHAHKVIIFGNHELGIQSGSKREPAISMIRDAGATYLEDSGIEIGGKLFWGSPWQPWFHDWEWNLPRGKKIAEKWKLIPNETNILVSHGPPLGILDQVPNGEHVGCEELVKRIDQLPNLQVSIFGHIHLGYGMVERNGTKFINGACCTESYDPINPPIVVEIS